MKNKTRMVRTILIAILLAGLLNSCSKKQGESAPDAASQQTAPKTSASTQSSGDSARPASLVNPRMIVRNGTMRLGSPDPQETVEKITHIVENLGGYVSNQSASHESYHAMTSEMTVRIPAARFDTALGIIRKSVKEVLSENISAEDQSTEYYDVESHLSAKKAELSQLEELYKSAKTVQDMVSIKSQIIQVQNEIDSFSGQSKNIERQVAYSTLEIYISSEGQQDFLTRIGMAIGSGAASFTDVLSGTVQFVIGGLPAIAALFGFIYLLIWLSRRSGRKKKREDSELPMQN
jgi:hypothetical protein